MTNSQEGAKKYWWIVLVVVPIAVALIGIVPKFTHKTSAPTDTFRVTSTKFAGDILFNDVEAVNSQARVMLNRELPKGELNSLIKATEFLKAREFEKAIPLLEDLAESLPVPAISSNLGAANLAIGEKENALLYFEQARGSDPTEEVALFNLNQIAGVVASVTDLRGVVVDVQAASLRYWGDDYLALASGLKVLFSKMRSFEVVEVSQGDWHVTPRVRVQVELLDGEIIEDDLEEASNFKLLNGSTEVGPFSLAISKVKRVEFKL